MKMYRVFLVAFFSLLPGLLLSYERPEYICEEVWRQVSDYLLPEGHPAKVFLDKICANERCIASTLALKRAGFENTTHRRYTRVVVASHPDAPEYLFKIYTDKQSFHKDQPEWKTWLNRIHGALLIKAYVKEKKWTQFEVPQKWLYLVPRPELARSENRKDFILVVEKKDLLSEKKNSSAWQDSNLSKDLLKNFYVLVTALGLRDCAKPANAPFTNGGTIAFIDTEAFGEWPVEYSKLTMALSRNRKGTWKKLISKSVHKLSIRKMQSLIKKQGA